MTAKNPQRRQELLSIAKRLFFQQGYENTSIADIHNGAGVSKGAFYHHFASKKDVLAAIVDDGIAAAVQSLTEISHSKTHSAIEKIHHIVALAFRSKVEPPQDLISVSQALQHDANVLLSQKMRRKWLQEATPVLDHVVQQGVSESQFRVAHTVAVSRVLLVVISDFTDQVQQQIASAQSPAERSEVVGTNLVILQTVLESLLKAEPGLLDFSTMRNMT